MDFFFFCKKNQILFESKEKFYFNKINIEIYFVYFVKILNKIKEL